MLQIYLYFLLIILWILPSAHTRDIDLIPPRKKEQHPLLSQAEQKKSISLFKIYPGLIENLPHIQFATLPTPIQKISMLSDTKNKTNIFVKRDDFSAPLIGGSMVRKLEFLLGEALFAKARCIVTTGFAGSNHVMATAFYSKQIGIPCVACLTNHKKAEQVKRNLLATHAFGCRQQHYKSQALLDIDLIKIGRQQKNEIGASPYFIPRGCSNKVGILGFVNAAFELHEQIRQGVMPAPDVIYVALGSSGLAAGLLVGLQLCGLSSKIIAVRGIADHSSKLYHKNKILSFSKEVIEYLCDRDEQFPPITIDENMIEIYEGNVNQDARFVSQETTSIMKNIEQTENLQFDESFTQKAFTALLNDLTSDILKEKTVLFWNSFCAGTFDGIIQNIDYKNLPADFHHYFESKNSGS